jgi:hypothetical protein
MSIFESLGGNEYQPLNMTYRPPTKETFVTGRTTTRWSPTSGSTYSGANSRVITFRLNGAELLDGNSCYLNMVMRTPRGHVIPEDLAPLSILSACRVTISGSQAEQFSNAADAIKPLVYVASDAQYLSNNASVTMGSWLYRSSPGIGIQANGANAIGAVVNGTAGIGGDTAVSVSSLGLKANESYKYVGGTWRRNSFPAGFQATTLSANTRFTGRQTTGQGMQGTALSIPLGIIFGLFRTSQLLPLRVMGAIEITIELNPPSRALIVCQPLTYSDANAISETAASVPPDSYTLDYELTQLSITGDLVAISPAMAASLDALAAGDDGVSLVIDSLATTLYPSQPNASQQSLVTTRPHSNLTSQTITIKPSVGANSPYWPKSFYFGGSTFVSMQTQIGGLNYPAQAVNSLSQAWLELRKALAGSRGVSLDRGSAVDVSAYSCTYGSPYGVWSAAARGAAPDITEINGSTATDATRAAFANTIASMSPACFVLGQSFSRVIGSEQETSLSGANSRLSGYSCQTNLQFRPFVQGTATDPLTNPANSLDSALFGTPLDFLVTQTISILIRVAQSSVMISD